MLGVDAVSQVGDLKVAVAKSWFVPETTGSAVRTDLTGAAIGAGLAAILEGPFFAPNPSGPGSSSK